MFKKNLFFIGRDKLIRTNIVYEATYTFNEVNVDGDGEMQRVACCVCVQSTKQQYLNFFRRRTKKLQGKNQGKAEKFLLS